MIKPPKLEPGMTIGILSPASATPSLPDLDKGIAGLEGLGYRVKVSKNARSRWGYLSAHDSDRIADIHALFKDKKVDAIVCARGGYGTGRIAPFLDYDLIRKNPKILCGFSDVTYLSLAIMKKTGLVTFSGPMVNHTFGDDPINNFTLRGFQRTLTTPSAPGSIWQEHPDRDFRIVTPGSARGRLTGGNISLVAATIGTQFEIQTRNRIVFLEEIGETPYRLDRMLTQLIQAGKLVDAAAIVVGRNVPVDECAVVEETARAAGLPRRVKSLKRKLERSFEPIMDDVFANLLAPLKIPVILGLPFGHIKAYATIPYGVMASMDAKSGDLVIEEPAVK